MSKYFSLAELLASDTAKKKGIDNTPTFEQVQHLAELAQWLDGFREFWGGPVVVSSGFRCDKLNKAVGGAKTSAHLTGWAADLQPKKGKQSAFNAAFLEWAKDKQFDQIIRETSGKTEWLHVGLRSQTGSQRRMILDINA